MSLHSKAQALLDELQHTDQVVSRDFLRQLQALAGHAPEPLPHIPVTNPRKE